MHFGIWSCIPLLVLIVGGFATRRMTEMMIVSSLIGSVILYRMHFFKGFVDLIYVVLSDDSFQFVLVLLMGVGGMMKLFERSGALAAFQGRLSGFVRSRKSALLATWLMTVVMFIDDYLNLLSVSKCMKKLSDLNRVPREHFAYTLNAMGVSVCLLIPCTSWSVFAIANMNQLDLGFRHYVKAIPFMFFSMASVVVSFLLVIGVIPHTGLIKKAYKRVDAGGPVLLQPANGGADIAGSGKDTDSAVLPTSVRNFFIPFLCLIVVMMIFDRQIQYGIVAACFCMLLLYKAQRIMTVGEFFNAFFDGMKEMSSIAFVVLFAYMIAKENELMGFAPFVVGNLIKLVTPKLLPLFIFIIMSLVAFTIGDVWALIVITMPIFIPLAQQMGVPEEMALGALLSGANFGAVMCMQSDALFMTYAGTGVPNIAQIRAGLPYVGLSAAVACAGYLIVGIM